MRRDRAIVLPTLLAGLMPLLSAIVANPSEKQPPSLGHRPVYNDHPPTGPLASTLDAIQFEHNRIAFISYSLASQIKEVLYQVPCYCPCDREEGHKSLLDCYTSRHGVSCSICQREVLFCYSQHKKGRDPARIRDAIAKGKAWKPNTAQYSENLYRQLRTRQP